MTPAPTATGSRFKKAEVYAELHRILALPPAQLKTADLEQLLYLAAELCLTDGELHRFVAAVVDAFAGSRISSDLVPLAQLAKEVRALAPARRADFLDEDDEGGGGGGRAAMHAVGYVCALVALLPVRDMGELLQPDASLVMALAESSSGNAHHNNNIHHNNISVGEHVAGVMRTIAPLLSRRSANDKSVCAFLERVCATVVGHAASPDARQRDRLARRVVTLVATLLHLHPTFEGAEPLPSRDLRDLHALRDLRDPDAKATFREGEGVRKALRDSTALLLWRLAAGLADRAGLPGAARDSASLREYVDAAMYVYKAGLCKRNARQRLPLLAYTFVVLARGRARREYEVPRVAAQAAVQMSIVFREVRQVRDAGASTDPEQQQVTQRKQELPPIYRFIDQPLDPQALLDVDMEREAMRRDLAARGDGLRVVSLRERRA
jgi:hypothetical protein